MTSEFHKAPKAWAQVKHRLLGKYLSLLLGKLGDSGNPVFYVDGFAGAGQLDDGSKGSPLVAAELAVNPLQKSRQGVLHCINVEADAKTFENLERATAEYVRIKRVKNFPGSFQQRLPDILSEIGDHTTFFFIDPFGTEGVEVDTLKAIASRRGKTEILVRYDDTRVKRLISWAVNNEDSFDEGHRKTARAFKARIDQLTDEEAAGLASSPGRASDLPDSRDLIEGYVRKVQKIAGLRFGLSYPIRNPQTKGHRYFLIHFCNFPDGYIHMANFMAQVERSVQGEAANDPFGLLAGQMEFMAINDEIVGRKRKDTVEKIAKRLPDIRLSKGWHKARVPNRELYAAIVGEFGWDVLRSEYVEALRTLEKKGIVSLSGTEDSEFTTFT